MFSILATFTSVRDHNLQKLPLIQVQTGWLPLQASVRIASPSRTTLNLIKARGLKQLQWKCDTEVQISLATGTKTEFV